MPARLDVLFSTGGTDTMSPTRQLRDAGQSIWLDDISKPLLRSGRLSRYVDQLSLTGVTSNPTILHNAIAGGDDDYDDALRRHVAACCREPQHLVYKLALDDLTAAADLLRTAHDASHGIDGFVSVEVPPSLVDDASSTVDAGLALFAQANRPNIMIKVPGTEAGLMAVEELIARGIPVNVTLLFSTAHYVAAADAYQRGLERRRSSGKSLAVASVASVFVSRWDAAADPSLPPELHSRLGIASCGKTYGAFLDVIAAARWRSLAAAGASPQRVLWASTSTKNPALPDTYYLARLVGPQTVDTIPEPTLLAFADHGEITATLGPDTTAADEVLAAVAAAGVDLDALASRLQLDGVRSFDASWTSLLAAVAAKVDNLAVASVRTNP
jgi:transaldolase